MPFDSTPIVTAVLAGVLTQIAQYGRARVFLPKSSVMSLTVLVSFIWTGGETQRAGIITTTIYGPFTQPGRQ
jgi:hypothetical protein